MTGRVPIARRALFQDRRRAALASGGVAAALLLVLMLQGIFDGAEREVTAYLRGLPAEVIVSEKNVRTMHMSVSALDPDAPAAVSQVEGVAWAEAIRFTTTFLVAGRNDQQLSYVIGYDPATGRGGPRGLSAGRPPRTGEIIIEEVAAERLGVGIGDDINVFGDEFRLVGLFRGGTTIVTSIAFVTTDDFAAHRGATVAYVLVGAQPGVDAEELAGRLATVLPDVTVQTRDRFAHEEAALVNDMSADLMRIMTIVALLIALAVIGLALFTLTLAKLREHAVVKALGGRTRRLLAVVLAETVWSVLLALTVATVLALGLDALLGRVNPAIAVTIEPSSVVRTGLAALVIGGVGAVVPLRRVAAVDPASAFRSGS